MTSFRREAVQMCGRKGRQIMSAEVLLEASLGKKTYSALNIRAIQCICTSIPSIQSSTVIFNAVIGAISVFKRKSQSPDSHVSVQPQTGNAGPEGSMAKVPTSRSRKTPRRKEQRNSSPPHPLHPQSRPFLLKVMEFQHACEERPSQAAKPAFRWPKVIKAVGA